MSASAPVDFVPLGIAGEAGGERRPLLVPPEPGRSQLPLAGGAGAGTIEIALPNGVRICVGGLVNETALSRVLRAMWSAL